VYLGWMHRGPSIIHVTQAYAVVLLHASAAVRGRPAALAAEPSRAGGDPEESLRKPLVKWRKCFVTLNHRRELTSS
jgi:hypothetical protein